MAVLLNTQCKYGDSPNVSGACWGYYLNGSYHIHDDENIFQYPPFHILVSDLDRNRFRNSKIEFKQNSAWYTVDKYNYHYDVTDAY